MGTGKRATLRKDLCDGARAPLHLCMGKLSALVTICLATLGQRGSPFELAANVMLEPCQGSMSRRTDPLLAGICGDGPKRKPSSLGYPFEKHTSQKGAPFLLGVAGIFPPNGLVGGLEVVSTPVQGPGIQILKPPTLTTN